MHKLFLALTLGLAAAAHGEPDQKVAYLSEPVLQIVKTSATKTPQWDATSTRQLRDAVWADGKLDDGEQDLLEELTSPRFQTITVGPGINVYPAGGPYVKTLQAAYLPPDLRAPGYENNLQSLVDQPHTPAVAYLYEDLYTVAEQSNIANRYKPVRDRLNVLVTASNKTTDPKRTRALIHEAMTQVDKGGNDKLPDYLYNWILTL
jgi:hypothetical protein